MLGVLKLCSIVLSWDYWRGGKGLDHVVILSCMSFWLNVCDLVTVPYSCTLLWFLILQFAQWWCCMDSKACLYSGLAICNVIFQVALSSCNSHHTHVVCTVILRIDFTQLLMTVWSKRFTLGRGKCFSSTHTTGRHGLQSKHVIFTPSALALATFPQGNPHRNQMQFDCHLKWRSNSLTLPPRPSV